MPRLRFSVLLALLCIASLAASPAAAQTNKPVLPAPSFGAFALPANVYVLMQGRKDLADFVVLIDKAGLEDLFANPRLTVTVFAPNNAALGKLPPSVAARINADKAALQNFVKYHVLSGSLTPASAFKGHRIMPFTANNEMLDCNGSGAVVEIGGAKILAPDLRARNGMVHIVDGPLVPRSLMPPPSPQKAPAAPAAAPAVTPPPAKTAASAKHSFTIFGHTFSW
ncbi:MAG TPA: fasciclin domain-containing protein [Alphaproteobacteria bacterium]|nr:fasciclin domain-containing protein [Alphaproteobacteria bacterium]